MRDRTALLAPLLVAALLIVFLPALPAGPGARDSGPVGAPHHRDGTVSAVVSTVPGPPPVAPALSGAFARMILSTSDPAAFPNDGVGTNLTAFGRSTFPPKSSFQTGAEEVIGSFEAVFGLFTNDKTPPVAFYEVFTNTTDQVVQLEYWGDLPITAGAPYDFRLQVTSGTDWTLSVNGAPFGSSAANATFDYGATAAVWTGGLGFSEIAIYSDTTTVPASYLATTALYVHRPSTGWYLPRNGAVTFNGTAGASWGVEGRTALPGLAPGEVVSGTALGSIRNTTTLWSGGPVPVNVTVAPGSPSVPGLGVIPVNVNVASTGGAALGGVPVYVGDSLGGNASPSTVLTSLAGLGGTLLTAPNESATSSDSVLAVVTILGYTGHATAPLTVTASVEVGVVTDTSTLTLAPGSNATLTIQTVDAAGQPYPGVAVALGTLIYPSVDGTTGSVGVSANPSAGITDISGHLAVVVSAPPIVGSFGIVVSVTSLGAWGHSTVHVTVRAAPPTFWEKYGPSAIVPAIVAAAAVVLGVAAVLTVRRRRRQRPPMPTMDLRQLRQDSGGDRPDAGGTGAPVSRTPPASGTP